MLVVGLNGRLSFFVRALVVVILGLVSFISLLKGCVAWGRCSINQQKKKKKRKEEATTNTFGTRLELDVKQAANKLLLWDVSVCEGEFSTSQPLWELQEIYPQISLLSSSHL